MSRTVKRHYIRLDRELMGEGELIRRLILKKAVDKKGAKVLVLHYLFTLAYYPKDPLVLSWEMFARLKRLVERGE